MSCQIVIVLGMHRSGTSAIAGHLHSLGLELPSQTLSAHPQDNPEGYFEPQRMVQLNNRLLAALGLNWQSTRPISAEELASPALDGIKEEIKHYLADTCQPGRQLVFKDPRLCRLLPVWLPLIQPHCEKPLIIHALRSANAVAASLARRAQQKELAGAAITNPQKATLLWLRYNLDAWHHIRNTTRNTGLPFTAVSYERLTQSRAQQNALHSWLNQHLNTRPNATAPLRPARPTPTTGWAPDQDWQLLLAHTENQLLENNTASDEWLAGLHQLAELRLPAAHQNDPVAPPPEDVTVAATIKHISGQQPKPLPVPRPQTKTRWQRFTAALKTAMPGKARTAQEQSGKDTQPEYLFISEHPSSRSHIYRVKNPVDALNRAGHRAAWLTPEQALAAPASWHKAGKLIMHRCEWSETLKDLYQLAHKNRQPVIYDIDDYIFEPKLIDQGHIDFINRLPADQQQTWKTRTQRFRQALLAADRALAPTHTLVDAINQLGVPCTLKPNGMSEETVALSAHWQHAFAALKKQPPKRLGYASGTPTHEGDFAKIRDVVAEFLNQQREWHLTIIGSLATDQLQQRLTPETQNRLEHRPLVAHINLPYELARLNLNLAPLETPNPFCDAKSPLKWFEAGACGVATLATATPTYQHWLEKAGRSGHLCATPSDWQKALCKAAIDHHQPPADQTQTDSNLNEKQLIGYILYPS